MFLPTWGTGAAVCMHDPENSTEYSAVLGQTGSTGDKSDACRSWEDYERKMKRGSASVNGVRKGLPFFECTQAYVPLSPAVHGFDSSL